MKLFTRQDFQKTHLRNSIKLLISTLLLAASIAALLIHCVYQTYHKGIHWSHGNDILDPITHAREISSLLYVASYSGIVTTLNLSLAGYRDTPVELQVLATTDGCAESPSWLTLDWPNGVLYCLDEGLGDGKNGSLASFATSENGTLTPLAKVSTIVGPVSAVMFGEWDYGLAVAHYGGSAFTTWAIQDPANITSLHTEEYNLSKPGPDPARQEAAHPHAAVVDPTGQFILVPDLGADLIRIYTVDAEGLKVTERTPLAVAPGSGPRHLAFVVKESKTFMYLVTELANTIVGYEVVYGGEFITFREIWSSGIHGEGKGVPQDSAAAEIAVSPDREFLLISSRNENIFKIPSFDASNNSIASDPLISFKIDGETGELALHQDVPCGGRFPRQFAINKAGTLVAVALQKDSRIVIIKRDVETGMLGDFIAYAQLDGEVTAVVFYN